MDQKAVLLATKAYIVKNFLLGTEGELEYATQLMEAGILDSTGVVELIGFLETTFGITIKDEEIIPENLNSLDYISEFVAQKSLERTERS